MRTTLTIEADVAHHIRQRMKQKGLSLKRVVNDALRAGLASEGKKSQPSFTVDPHPCRFKAGIDLDRLNQLVDEMEVEESLKSLIK